MAELEAKGEKSLDNYQRFAKAFKVKYADQVLSEKSRANAARLKLGLEMKNSLMSGSYEIANTPLRAILYASYELENENNYQSNKFQNMYSNANSNNIEFEDNL